MSQSIDLALRKKMVDLIQVNKISTTEVADVLGKKGHLEGLAPLNVYRGNRDVAHRVCFERLPAPVELGAHHDLREHERAKHRNTETRDLDGPDAVDERMMDYGLHASGIEAYAFSDASDFSPRSR